MTSSTLRGYLSAAIGWFEGMPFMRFEEKLDNIVTFLNSYVSAMEELNENATFAAMPMKALGGLYDKWTAASRNPQHEVERIAQSMDELGDIARQKSSVTLDALQNKLATSPIAA